MCARYHCKAHIVLLLVAARLGAPRDAMCAARRTSLTKLRSAAQVAWRRRHRHVTNYSHDDGRAFTGRGGRHSGYASRSRKESRFDGVTCTSQGGPRPSTALGSRPCSKRSSEFGHARRAFSLFPHRGWRLPPDDNQEPRRAGSPPAYPWLFSFCAPLQPEQATKHRGLGPSRAFFHRLVAAGAALLSGHVAKDLLDVHAAAGERRLLAISALNSSTHAKTPG